MDNRLKRGVLLAQLLQLVKQQWVTEADFDKLPEKMGITDLQARIFIMTQVTGLIRSLPEEIFANDDTKQNLLTAAQENLDTLIEQEAEAEFTHADSLAAIPSSKE